MPWLGRTRSAMRKTTSATGATFEAITERLNGDGEVEETERETYEQYPLEGVIYEELVARDGPSSTARGVRPAP